MKKLLIAMMLFVFIFSVNAQDFKKVELPAPRKDGGKQLLKALNDRKTNRSFKEDKLPLQLLSDRLWAAFGVNRPDNGKRTAPSAMNNQEIDLYVCLSEGVYIYNAEKNTLDPVFAGDVREKMGKQDFVGVAPVVIVYVADYSRMGVVMTKDQKAFYSAVDTGLISENVYLFCSSEDLATVVLGYIDRDKMAEILKLKGNQKVQLTQPVGYPE